MVEQGDRISILHAYKRFYQNLDLYTSTISTRSEIWLELRYATKALKSGLPGLLWESWRAILAEFRSHDVAFMAQVGGRQI